MEDDNVSRRRPDTSGDRSQGTSSRRGSDASGWLWPMVALGVLVILGLLFFGNMGTDQTDTQVGQKTERPATPSPGTTPTQK